MGTAKREPDGATEPRRIRTFEDLALRESILRAIQLVNGYIRYLEKSRKATP